jgi:hypothetical protein
LLLNKTDFYRMSIYFTIANVIDEKISMQIKVLKQETKCIIKFNSAY